MMACSISASSSRLLFNQQQKLQEQPKKRAYFFRVRAANEDPDDCNTEECAPDKEVGTVSMEWLAGEKTRVVGTFPPRNRGWTGYIEKDTAGQTNIYSVEPAVYIAESAISSGSAGSSSDGADNTAAIVGGIALISLAAASSVLLQVGKNPPVVVQTAENYAGPSLTYYINKFKPPEVIETFPAPAVTTVPLETETSPQVSQSEVDVASPPVTTLETQTSPSEVSQSEVDVESPQEALPSDSAV